MAARSLKGRPFANEWAAFCMSGCGDTPAGSWNTVEGMNRSLALEVLEDAQYVMVVTYRRDGTAVPTPVWAVRVADEIQVWTNPTAGKVKRIRRNPRVQLAPCGQRGEYRGRLIDGTARILDESEIPGVLEALVAKYGWQARMTQVPNAIAGLLGMKKHPVGAVAISLV